MLITIAAKDSHNPIFTNKKEENILADLVLNSQNSEINIGGTAKPSEAIMTFYFNIYYI
jgi:hypothetical protein